MQEIRDTVDCGKKSLLRLPLQHFHLNIGLLHPNFNINFSGHRIFMTPCDALPLPSSLFIPCHPLALKSMLSLVILVAEVSCVDVVNQARRMRHKSKGCQALASVKLKKSETGAHKVFRAFGQSLPIRLSRTNLPTLKRFPYISFSTWFRHLVKNDELQRLVGVQDHLQIQDRLLKFWDHYFHVDKEHIIYDRHMAGDLCVSRTIPVLHHGDEGRGYKKRQLMVLATHGVLGMGSLHDQRMKEKGHLPLNYKGNTYLTHFLTCVLPISLYGDCPESFDHMLDVIACEFRDLFLNGIVVDGVKWWICCLGVKGDAPYLTKSGHFDRSFYRRPTAATSRTPCIGVCHLCCAGKEDWVQPVPYEDFGESPSWIQTIGLLKPYSELSPLFKIPFSYDGERCEAIFRFDLFHNWHSGIGKAFASSAAVNYLDLIEASSLEKKLEILTADFQMFCRKYRHSPYYKRLTKALFGINSLQDQPAGSWTKGDYTRLMCEWLEDSFPRFLDGRTADPLHLKMVLGLP